MIVIICLVYSIYLDSSGIALSFQVYQGLYITNEILSRYLLIFKGRDLFTAGVSPIYQEVSIKKIADATPRAHSFIILQIV